MILELVIIILIICVIVFLLNTRDDKIKMKMSIKESLDLVGLPIVTFYQGHNKFNFLLDTGANNSVINESALELMEHNILDVEGTLSGLNGIPVKVQYADIHINYNDTTYDAEFQVTNMDEAFNNIKAESGIKLVGIIGNNFFQKYKYILDFDKLAVYTK